MPLSIREQLEADRVKPFETVNHDPNDIEAAKKAARDRRNATNREKAAALSKEYFEKNIKESIENFEQKTGIKTDVQQHADGDDGTREQRRDQDGKFAKADAGPGNQPVDDEGDLDDDSLSLKVTRTVNGKKVIRSVKEWLETASKVENADEYLTEAARLRAAPGKQAPVAVTVPELNKKEIIKALQEGSEAEAEAALDKVLQTAEVRAQQATTKAQFEAQWVEAFSRVRQANPDIAGDALLWDRATRLEGMMNPNLTLKAEGVEKKTFDPNNVIKDFELRLTEAVSQTRQWVEGMKGSGAAAERKQQLTLKKKQMASVTGANGSAVGGDPDNKPGPFGQTFKSQAEYLEHVAREMNKKRKTRLE